MQQRWLRFCRRESQFDSALPRHRYSRGGSCIGFFPAINVGHFTSRNVTEVIMKKGLVLSLYLFAILTLWSVVSLIVQSRALYGADLSQITLQIDGMT